MALIIIDHGTKQRKSALFYSYFIIILIGNFSPIFRQFIQTDIFFIQIRFMLYFLLHIKIFLIIFDKVSNASVNLFFRNGALRVGNPLSPFGAQVLKCFYQHCLRT